MVEIDQKQTASNGGQAIQAGGHVQIVTYQGLSPVQIAELVDIFIEQKLPALRATAADVAKARTEEFLKQIAIRLEQPNKTSDEEFAQPDAQACLNTALYGAATKGSSIDLDLLLEAVIKRLESASDPLMKNLTESAVSSLARIGKEHIAFLAFVHYVKHISHQNIGLEGFRLVSQLVMSVVQSGLTLSQGNREYLASLGLLTINPVSDAELFLGQLQQNYPFLPVDPAERDKAVPELRIFLASYSAMMVPTIHLTATGKLIALLALKKIFPNLDFAVWIS